MTRSTALPQSTTRRAGQRRRPSLAVAAKTRELDAVTAELDAVCTEGLVQVELMRAMDRDRTEARRLIEDIRRELNTEAILAAPAGEHTPVTIALHQRTLTATEDVLRATEARCDTQFQILERFSERIGALCNKRERIRQALFTLELIDSLPKFGDYDVD
jgi:hypothetical protein